LFCSFSLIENISFLYFINKCLKSNIRSRLLSVKENVKKYYECEGSKWSVKIELNGRQFVVGRLKEGDMICCWLTP
jgi:hypothetical protein